MKQFLFAFIALLAASNARAETIRVNDGPAQAIVEALNNGGVEFKKVSETKFKAEVKLLNCSHTDNDAAVGAGIAVREAACRANSRYEFFPQRGDKITEALALAEALELIPVDADKVGTEIFDCGMQKCVAFFKTLTCNVDTSKSRFKGYYNCVLVR